MNKQTTIALQSFVFAVALFATASLALAADGEKLINMTKVATGGITPGDTPGFPVTISQPGSYRLSGNLTVPNSNTNAIEIAAEHVTINLNGFAILGTANCSGGFPCANEGTGSGITLADISLPKFNITIRNGTIQGMGSAGIQLFGDSILVEDMHLRSNGGSGILIFQSFDKGSSIARHNTVQRNGGFGISIDRGLVSHSVVDVNHYGIYLGTGTVSNNVITRNAVHGIILGSNLASYIGNTLAENGSSAVFGGVNMGQNLCDGVVCPGAKY